MKSDPPFSNPKLLDKSKLYLGDLKSFLLVILTSTVLQCGVAQCIELDPNFGNQGIAQVSMSPNSVKDSMRYSFIDNDGRIVSIGYTFVNNKDAMAVSFHTPFGVLDNNISGDGKILYVESEDNYGNTGLNTSDGKYLIGGHWDFFQNDNFTFRKYNSDGSKDQTWGVDGSINEFLQESVIQEIRGLSVTASEEIVAMGVGERLGLKRLVYMKLNEFGETLIEPFLVNLPLSDSYILQRQTTYKNSVLGIGYSTSPNFTQGALVKLDTDGNLDSEFGINGIRFTPGALGQSSKLLNAICIEDEIIIAIGYSTSPEYNTIFMIALDDEGNINSNYFEDGYSSFEIDASIEPIDFDMDEDNIYIAANDRNTSEGQIYKLDLLGKIVNSFADDGLYRLGSLANVSLTRIHKVDQGIIVTGVADNDFTIWKLNDCVDVSLDEKLIGSKFYLYPNPVNDVLHIDMDTEDFVKPLHVVDENGRVVKAIPKAKYSTEKISVEVKDLPPGKYFIHRLGKLNTTSLTFIKI